MGFFGSVIASIISAAVGLFGGRDRRDPPTIEAPRRRFDEDEKPAETILGANEARKFQADSEETSTTDALGLPAIGLGGGSEDDPVGGLSVSDNLGL